METYSIETKQAVKVLKAFIKERAKLQTIVKEHRKTERFTGERIKLDHSRYGSSTYHHKWTSDEKDPILYPWRAQEYVPILGHELRILYAAYGKMRGKSWSQIENAFPEEGHPLKDFEYFIDNTIKWFEEYAKTLCADKQEA